MDIYNLGSNLEAIYNDRNFFIMLESHLTYLRNDPTSTPVSLTQFQNYKYEGDFYGILSDLNIEPQYHYICMRINGIENSSDYDGKLYQITIPNLAKIDLLKNICQTNTGNVS